MKCSCKGCKNRGVGCHSKCRLYSKWKAEQDDLRKWRNEESALRSYFKMPERWKDHLFM